MTKAMIMAAGVGSRLEPLTLTVPKPLVPMANVPVMDILLDKLFHVGIVDVIANTHYLSEQIVERYKENNFGINFNYVYEKELSGTAGGVKKCQFFFDKGEDFIVLSADGVSGADLVKAMEIHKKSGAVATIGIKQFPLEEIPNFGVVVTDKKGFITEFQEKPRIKDAKSDYVNTGIYVFNYKIFDYIPADTFYDFAKDVFPKLLADKQINTFKVNEYWSDIGTLNQYLISTQDLFDGLFSFKHEKINKTETGAYIVGKGTYVSKDAKFIGNSVIGANCIIGKNVTLENSVIWDDVELADNIKLTNCIIASHSEIKADLTSQVIGENQIIGLGIYR